MCLYKLSNTNIIVVDLEEMISIDITALDYVLLVVCKLFHLHNLTLL